MGKQGQLLGQAGARRRIHVFMSFMSIEAKMSIGRLSTKYG
jgi:hypothetical protein